MSSALVLAPVIGAGIGLAAAYGVRHKHGKRRIHFVERDELEEVIEHLDITVGAAETCIECGDEVTPEEVGALVKDDGEYRVVCNKATCLDTYDLE